MPSSISCLSTELLLEVFLHAHDHMNAHRKLQSSFLSQVCRSWREVAFLAQELWSVIAIHCKKDSPDDPRLSLAELFAERAGDRPLIILVHAAVAYPRLVALIRQNARRVESLSLYIESLSVLDSLGGKAFPSLQRASVLVLSALIWPDTTLALAFPNCLCTNLQDLTLSGGLQPSNFDIPSDKIRQLDVNFHSINAIDDPRANTVHVQLFEALPALETLKATLIQPAFGSRGFQSPFRWVMRPAVNQHNLTSFQLTCNSEQFEWIPELPRLQRLQLKVIDRGQHGIPQSPDTLISFFRRAGCQIQFLDLYIEAGTLRRHPDIWESLLPLIPKVRVLRTSVEQDGRMEILLNHHLTNPRLLPYLHTLRLHYLWSSESIRHTLYLLRAMLRSRGWTEDEDPELSIADTHLRAVFINIAKTNLDTEGAQVLEDWQTQLRAGHGGRFMLQISHHFDGSEPEIIGGSLFVD